jgi:acetyl-CoA acetyltransferase/uncharacterized OB-fold protein
MLSESVVRPIPALTPETEFFWKSGQDGKLRIQKCSQCLALVHPPAPACRYCGSAEVEPSVVSGRGTVEAVTVNEHTWLVDWPAPYNVVIVALEDDPRVRLLSNVFGSKDEEIEIGSVVEVDFVHANDIWYPVFRATGERQSDRPSGVDPKRFQIQKGGDHNKFENRVSITGVGQSDVGRRLMRSPIELAANACRLAIADAGLEPGDIDGVATFPGEAPLNGMSEGGATPVVEALGLQPLWINGAPIGNTNAQLGSILTGMLAVASGMCKHVLCFRTVWQSTYSELLRSGRLGNTGMTSSTGGPPVTTPIEPTSEFYWRSPFGAVSATNWAALHAASYFRRFGRSRRDLAAIALNNRHHAMQNPSALYRDPLSLDEYMDARMISDPLCLYDCDGLIDGSIAFVISSSEIAPDLRQRPVQFEAVGTRMQERTSGEQGFLSFIPGMLGPAAHMWSRTSLNPADVDVAELYDGFSIICLNWLEALGFCEFGTGGEFVGDGSRTSLTGELPLNTDGGQLSGGRLHGYRFLQEAVLQLRGIAGERQVADASVAVVSNAGVVPGLCMLLTAE